MIGAWGDSVHPQNHSSSNNDKWGPEGSPNNMVVTIGCLPEPAAEMLLKTLHFGQRTWKAPAGAAAGLLPEVWLLQC